MTLKTSSLTDPNVEAYYDNAGKIIGLVSSRGVQTPLVPPNTAPVAQTVGASPYTYTNSSTGQQQIIVGADGTVSAITQGGVDCKIITGTFILSPGEALVVTYSSLPTVTVKQLF